MAKEPKFILDLHLIERMARPLVVAAWSPPSPPAVSNDNARLRVMCSRVRRAASAARRRPPRRVSLKTLPAGVRSVSASDDAQAGARVLPGMRAAAGGRPLCCFSTGRGSARRRPRSCRKGMRPGSTFRRRSSRTERFLNWYRARVLAGAGPVLPGWETACGSPLYAGPGRRPLHAARTGRRRMSLPPRFEMGPELEAVDAARGADAPETLDACGPSAQEADRPTGCDRYAALQQIAARLGHIRRNRMGACRARDGGGLKRQFHVVSPSVEVQPQTVRQRSVQMERNGPPALSQAARQSAHSSPEFVSSALCGSVAPVRRMGRASRGSLMQRGAFARAAGLWVAAMR
jgi:hypothetical protein